MLFAPRLATRVSTLALACVICAPAMAQDAEPQPEQSAQAQSQAQSQPQPAGANEIIVINWYPNIGFLIILDFDSIRVSFIPTLQNFTFGKATSDVRIDGIPDIEAKVLSFAFHQSSLQGFMVQIPTDENESALSLFTLFPKSNLITKIATKQHVDTLEHEFLVHPLYRKNTLVSEQIFAFIAHQ